ncbi:FAD binding domain-containing protein [Pollutimonas bauzanensis]|uniref:Carbon-monoxide dehydrogenase medium subunit n=1 Tax=Pollutimonas bauzanensis TaxID=658167 RepID=A0A1M5QIU1_9BURK|nr:FAD binding domain-containing protein [Pollutimonas bauzanensis]SHH13730.1 carbon-monoxide dehydrogenase medium subunit [Pollutimonas bauzanensis]
MGEPKFEYLVPYSIEEAVAFRGKYGNAAQFISGGTEIVPMITRGKIQQGFLIELTALADLAVLERHDGGLRIGAAVPLSRLAQSTLVRERWSALAEASASIREPQVRNRGTIGGNVAHGVPSADLVPALLAFGARVKVQGPKAEREMDLEKFLLGPYRTALEADELVVEILLPEPEQALGSAFFKLTKFGGSGLSVATVAAAVSTRDGVVASARITFGSAGPIPCRVPAAEEFLKGKRPGDEVLAQVGALVSAAAEPREGSIRASPMHRRRVLKPLAERAVALAVRRSSGQF